MLMPTEILDTGLSQSTTNRIDAAFEAMRQGIPVVLFDDDDRENEADLIVAAERISEESMAMMIRDGSGIVCLCLTPEKAESVGLHPMVKNNGSRFQTAFTVTIEAKEGVTTGVSAKDRVTTIQAAIGENGQDAIVCPGHVFPLIARPGGVLERGGHTEGSVDLARLAGLRAEAVLCELMNPDGTMMKGEQVIRFATLHQLPMLTIAELIDYRHGRNL